MAETPNIGLDVLAAEQAQKHITMNEALLALDAIVQLAVLDRDLTVPPGSPDEGDRYLVKATATGAWAGHDGEIAAWDGSAWLFFTPREGWLAWIADEDALLVFDGSDWGNAGSGVDELQNLSLLGIGTTADATNPFAAKLNKALWTAKSAAEGGDGDLRYTLNKETAADVLSLLLQTGFEGRAEIGLIGDDNLTVKVSADGNTWNNAIVIDKDDGSVTLPSTSLDASDTEPGIVELATYAETQDGVLDDRAVTPAALGAFAAFRATPASAQTGIPNATTTKVDFGAEDFDTGGHYDAVNSRWTPPAGPVLIVATVRFATTNQTDGVRLSCSIRKNGLGGGGGGSVVTSGTTQKHAVRAVFIDVANGTDYYEVVVAQFSGATMDLDGDTSANNFSGTRLR